MWNCIISEYILLDSVPAIYFIASFIGLTAKQMDEVYQTKSLFSYILYHVSSHFRTLFFKAIYIMLKDHKKIFQMCK